LDAVQKKVGWSSVEADADPDMLWQLIETKHKVHSASKVEAVVKLTARTQLAACRQGDYESIVMFKQRYNNALKSYHDQRNPMDIKQAYELYGEPVGSVRGKMVKKKQSRAIYDGNLILDKKKQVIHTDVRHLDGQHFMITVCEPLQLLLQCPIERETALVLGNTLQNQIDLLRSRGFVLIRGQADPQSAFRSLSTKFENILIDTGGAGDYVPKVDIQIFRVKEMVRGIKATLPWKSPPVLLKDLGAFAVSRIIIKRLTAVSHNICARVRFTGIKPDYKRELSLGFGDYCEVYDGTDNTT
jgi:hypothetical protein